ncbi:DUF5681 domain-containing protein [Bradyrhizobium sp. LTSP857]|uniref:DUF5681 domain-containing protein n=1 Tax=Bradyrhizobium sp. LTSP857 TaxID=1619231 RepID=UPI0005D1A061|nr:DUF5681 domain-containing protein [Bradyrhizobium sp. LTSP857]KJC36499.1 hypothetical protein UP06_32855 [Bradyrhizobium sp. LTSP857]
MSSLEHQGAVGYGRPPVGSRFVKGRSGNPAGRPPARHLQLPYESVLGQTFTILDNGVERQATAIEVFLLKVAKRGLDGDTGASRTMLTLLKQVREQQQASEQLTIVLVAVAPGSVTGGLEILRIATKLDPYRETARMVIEPWAAEAALERLPQPLTPAQQRTVVDATRTPKRVRWPEWWSEYP